MFSYVFFLLIGCAVLVAITVLCDNRFHHYFSTHSASCSIKPAKVYFPAKVLMSTGVISFYFSRWIQVLTMLVFSSVITLVKMMDLLSSTIQDNSLSASSSNLLGRFTLETLYTLTGGFNNNIIIHHH